MTNSDPLPFDQSLFIATSNAVYLRSPLANKKLFECESANGIVSARASHSNSSPFAVADGQIVILHDATLGADKKYKLRNNDVQCLRPNVHGPFADTNRAYHDFCSSHPTGERCISRQR